MLEFLTARGRDIAALSGRSEKCWRTWTCSWRKRRKTVPGCSLSGPTPGRVQVTGNLKFDQALPSPPPIVDTLRRSLAAEGAGPLLVCGSTVEDEEAPLLKAFENLRVSHPRAVMMLAPRHPERFDDVAILIQRMQIPLQRRSLWKGEPLAGGVFLVDTIGELAALYVLADVAFVGGSLVPRGGHNIIEPAQHGVAIVTGNHTENFRDIVGLFQRRDAVRIVSLAELPLTLMHLLANDSERKALGQRAKETIQSQTGATSRVLAAQARYSRVRVILERFRCKPHTKSESSFIHLRWRGWCAQRPLRSRGTAGAPA